MPVAKKTANKVVFRRFQGEGVEFFKIRPHWPHQIFDAHLLVKTNLCPSRFPFSVSFKWRLCFGQIVNSLFKRMGLKRKRAMFIHTNQPLIKAFYIKRYSFSAELAMSQHWSVLFCATGAWGGKPIGRVRVK